MELSLYARSWRVLYNVLSFQAHVRGKELRKKGVKLPWGLELSPEVVCPFILFCFCLGTRQCGSNTGTLDDYLVGIEDLQLK